jgi:hypothetical protein
MVRLFTHGKRVAGIDGASAGGFGMMVRLTAQLEGQTMRNLAGLGYEA